jgi:diguanylate cyclase (GGDEF)-like protein/PAS domain S-box-containing protein
VNDVRPETDDYRLLVESVRDYAIFILDPHGLVQTWNAGAQAIKGYRAEEIVGRSFSLFYTPDAVAARHPQRELELAERDGRYEEEGWRVRKDGTMFWANVVFTALRRDDGSLRGFGKVTRDLTERKLAADRIGEAEERFRRAFADAPTGAALLDEHGRVTGSNTALGLILAQEADALVGQAFDELIPPGRDERDGLVDLSDGHRTELWMSRRVSVDGQAVWTDIRVVPLRDVDGVLVGYLAHVQDISHRRAYEEKLATLADTDALTGLINRRRFGQELDAHLERSARYGHAGALLMLDLDNFKRINDTLGHNVGDELIIGVADLLRRTLRTTDVVCRLGGDEFAVLLTHGDQREAVQVAEMLVSSVREEVTVFAGGRSRPISVSIGVSVIEHARVTSGELMAATDAAMYDAKDAGRNGWALASSEDHAVPRSRARILWADRIERAIAEDGFTLVAQPIQDVASGAVHSHELLLRMNEPDGLVPPQSFLYIAERLGLIADVDRWVVRNALALLEQLQAVDPARQLEVNISGHSIGDVDFRDDIAQMVSDSAIDRHGLVFEITETAAVSQICQAKAFAEHLRELGCRFALDDFGAGFGSFYYLKHLPFDIVKIDGEFVSACTSNRMDQMVIRSLVTIAHGLGKQTVAEFVGDRATLDFLGEVGVDLAQGYYVGRPVPLSVAFPTLDLHPSAASHAVPRAPAPRAPTALQNPMWPGAHEQSLAELESTRRRGR